MLFQHVAIAGLAHVDAPHRLSSDEINARLKPTLDRLGIRTDVLKDIAGIHARRMWDDNVLSSDVATLAGVKALADAGIAPERVGLLINTSVSRSTYSGSAAVSPLMHCIPRFTGESLSGMLAITRPSSTTKYVAHPTPQ